MRDPEVGQAARGLDDVLEVQHRLAHAHEDAVVDGLDAAEVQRLVEDLGGGEVAPEAHRAGRAERAGERAAGLGGDADRAAPVAVAHQHRLDRVAVVGAEERLDRPVLRLGLCSEDIEVELADNLRVRIVKSTLMDVRSKGEPVKDAT